MSSFDSKSNQDPILIIANSKNDADMLYATGIFVPDPFTLLQLRDRKIIMMNDLEIDRARSQAKVDEVVSLTEYTDKIKGKENSLINSVVELLHERDVHTILVPNRFPFGYAEQLRDRGISVNYKNDPFWDDRPLKTHAEVTAISEVSKTTEDALKMVFGILSESTVKNGFLQGPEGQITSEYIRRQLHIFLLERDCIAQHTIVAGGIQGCDPHNEGKGPLKAGEPIIIDLFPKSTKTGYFADITRTVAKGPVPDIFLRLYDTVLEAQQKAISLVKPGIDGRVIHESINNFFKKQGYNTGLSNGRMQGFFHGTGHGFGLEIHEAPRISSISQTLQVGHAVTIEPGLYYPDLGGGVRIEDNIIITEKNSVNLTKIEKDLVL